MESNRNQLVMAKSTIRLVNIKSLGLFLASLWENFWMRSAQKFSNCFCAHDFAVFKGEI